MKRALVTIYLVAAMLACGAPPEYGVYAVTSDGLTELHPGLDGTYQTIQPKVVIIASDQVATTAAISRAELLTVKHKTGETVKAQLAQRPIVIEEASHGEAPVELTLTAAHPCCMGSLWRVETLSMGAAQEFFVWANDLPGDSLEGD